MTSNNPTLPTNAAARPNPEIRPEFCGVESWRSIALYGTLARSPHAAAAASNANPGNKYAGRSRIRLIALTSPTTMPVNTVRAMRRRRGCSTQTPITGASTAMVKPAIASARPSQLAGGTSPGKPLPTVSVRYTENTNVTTIALTPAAPVSHSAQASTWDRGDLREPFLMKSDIVGLSTIAACRYPPPVLTLVPLSPELRRTSAKHWPPNWPRAATV